MPTTSRAVLGALTALALAAGAVGCSADPQAAQPENAIVTATTFQPSDMREIAQVSDARVRGVVRSQPRLFPVPSDPAPPGADGSAAPSVYSYEVVEVEVTAVLGKRTDGLAAGSRISVGVSVLTPPPGVVVEDADEFVAPGETFGQVGQSGMFFLTPPRPLGEFGPGREIVGFAEYGSQSSKATVLAVAGNFRGTVVDRQAVEDAAAS